MRIVERQHRSRLRAYCDDLSEFNGKVATEGVNGIIFTQNFVVWPKRAKHYVCFLFHLESNTAERDRVTSLLK